LSLFSELKRRNVFRVAAAYTVTAWLLIQVVATIFPAFGFADSAIRIVTIILAIGLIPTLIISWAFEFTPEGLKKETDIVASQSVTLHTGKNLDRMIMVVLAMAIGYFALDKFVLDPARDETRIEHARQEARKDALTESAGDRSVAVLPFVNMSSDTEQEYFADGMTEEILNMLTKVPGLRVTARTSSFFFKGKDIPVKSIAETLNVRHILEGSVRKSGNRVRITAQLIDARSDAHLWSETYDRELTDIFQIQDEVSTAIASMLVESFVSLDVNPVSRTNSVAAFEAYRTGRLRWWRRSPDELHRAIELFEKAIEYDPGFAPAYAAIADSWLLLVLYGDVHFLNGLEAAEPMIDRALSIDHESVEAIAARGLSRFITGDNDAAEAALNSAISLDGDYVPARVWMSALLGNLGRIPEQGRVLQEALAMDPLNQILTINYAVNLQIRGEYSSANNTLESLFRLQPGSAIILSTLAELASTRGDLVGAWKYAKRAHDADPTSAATIATFARAWHALGEFGEAESVLLAGIEKVTGNVELKNQYIKLMLSTQREEEAEKMIYRLFGRDVSGLPAKIQRLSHFSLGLLASLKSDWVTMRDELEQAIDPVESQMFDNDQVFILSTVAVLHRGMGNDELAEQRLQTAERVVGHARINGVDDGEFYYTISCLFALRGEKERALQALQQAYDKGWHQISLLKKDGRLASLRDEEVFQIIQQQLSEDQARARMQVQEFRESE
jgi:TolB-like protein/Tfp pilus assembly protein PilF